MHPSPAGLRSKPLNVTREGTGTEIRQEQQPYSKTTRNRSKACSPASGPVGNGGRNEDVLSSSV